MSKHVVLGGGNLALAIHRRLIEMGHSVEVLDRKGGFDYPCPLKWLALEEADMIWNCVGAGGVAEGEKYPNSQLLAHVGLTKDLVESFPETRQVHFGSLYAENGQEGMSWYAFTKWAQQKYLEPRLGELVALVRVTNLYGWDYPERCLPFKVASSALEGVVKSSRNGVHPTSCEWVASIVTSEDNEASLFDGSVKDLWPWKDGYATPAIMAACLVDHGVDFVVKDTGIDRKHPDQTDLASGREVWWKSPVKHDRLPDLMSRALREVRKRKELGV